MSGPFIGSARTAETVNGCSANWMAAAGVEGEDEKLFIRQRAMGSFTHRVRLSDSVDAEKIEADYEGGVLKVRVPLQEKAQPRKVEVKAPAMAELPA